MSDVNGRKRTRRRRRNEQAIRKSLSNEAQNFFLFFIEETGKPEKKCGPCIPDSPLFLVYRVAVFAHAFMFTREMEHSSLIQVFLSQRALKLKDASFASIRTELYRAKRAFACQSVLIKID